MKFSVVLFHHGRAATLAIAPGSSPARIEFDVRALFAEPRSLRRGKALKPARTVRGGPGVRVSASADGKDASSSDRLLRATSTPLLGFYDSIAKKLVRLEDASADPASNLTSKFGYYPVFAEAEKAFQVAARVSYESRLNKPLYSILLKDKWPHTVLKVPDRPRFRERFNFGSERELVGAMNGLGLALAVRMLEDCDSNLFLSPLALCGSSRSLLTMLLACQGESGSPSSQVATSIRATLFRGNACPEVADLDAEELSKIYRAISRGVDRSFRLSKLPFRVRLAYCLPPDALLRARGVDEAPVDCGQVGPVYDALAEMKSWEESERTWISSIHAKNTERAASLQPALGADPIGRCIARAHKRLDGTARELLGCEKLYFDFSPGASDVVDTWVVRRTSGSKGKLSSALSGELSQRGRGAFHVRRDSVLFASLISLVMEQFGLKGRASGDGDAGASNFAKKQTGQLTRARETKSNAFQAREDRVRDELASIFHGTLDRNSDGLVSKQELLLAAQRSGKLRTACSRVPGLARLLQPRQWRKVFKELDSNNDAILTEDEFVDGVLEWGKRASVEIELRTIFLDLLDRDGDGRVTKKELLRAAQTSSALRDACSRVPGLSNLLRPGRWQQAFKELDDDKSASLDEKEFVRGVLSWAQSATKEGKRRRRAAENVVASQIVESVLESVFATLSTHGINDFRLETRSTEPKRCRTFEGSFFGRNSKPTRRAFAELLTEAYCFQDTNLGFSAVEMEISCDASSASCISVMFIMAIDEGGRGSRQGGARWDSMPDLYNLIRRKARKELAHVVVPRVLRSPSSGTPARQFEALRDALHWAGLANAFSEKAPPEEELCRPGKAAVSAQRILAPCSVLLDFSESGTGTVDNKCRESTFSFRADRPHFVIVRDRTSEAVVLLSYVSS